MSMKMEQKIKLATYSLTILAILLGFSALELIWFSHLNWITVVVILLMLLLIVHIVLLHHHTHSDHGPDASEEFFNFPMNLITAIATLLFIYQVVKSIENTNESRHEALLTNLSQYSGKIVVRHWETYPMLYPELNAHYYQVFSNITGLKNGFMTEEQWLAKYPNIPYVPFEGNELAWHYSAQFCQQMVDVIRILQLEKSLPVDTTQAAPHIIDSDNEGWVATFRMFLNAPAVRNVWEQYKYRHGSPQVTAWVQYYILDVIDRDPDYRATHDAQWLARAQKILDQSKIQYGTQLSQKS